MKTPIKILVGIACALVVLALSGAAITAMQRRDGEQIQKLREELGKAKADAQKEHERAQVEAKRGEEWRATAQVALDRVGRLEGRLKGVEAKLAALGPQPPATAPESLPVEVAAIAKAMTDAGVKAAPLAPPVGPLEIGMAGADARHGLGLILDGKNYPEALERIGLLEETVDTLKEQKAGLQDAVEAKTQEAASNLAAYEAESRSRASAEGAVLLQEQIIHEKDALLRKERAKKWVWGGSGAGIALLVLLL
jgi:hypothetical protein